MCKSGQLASGAGGDDVADLHVAIGHDDAVDEQLDQLALLLEGRAARPAWTRWQNASTGRTAGDLGLAVGLRRQLARLPGQPAAALPSRAGAARTP